MRDKVSVRLAYLITFLWTISFFADLLIKTYDPPATIHALMMAVAGGFLAPDAIKGLRNNNDKQR